MAYEVLRSAACDRDIERIFDHLVTSYRDLGDPAAEAFGRAAARVMGIEDALQALGEVPFQGTLEPQILPSLRHVTKDRAVFYFTLDEEAEVLRVLAVFFGGQDHRHHLLARIAAGEEPGV